MNKDRPNILIEGPFETDYSLAVVNRNLTRALLQLGHTVAIHQRDNTTPIPFSGNFAAQYPELASQVVSHPAAAGAAIHSRCLYPPTAIPCGPRCAAFIVSPGKNPSSPRATCAASTMAWS